METTDEFKYAIESIKEYYEKNNKFVEGKMPNPASIDIRVDELLNFAVDKLKKDGKKDVGFKVRVKQAINDLYDELNTWKSHMEGINVNDDKEDNDTTPKKAESTVSNDKFETCGNQVYNLTYKKEYDECMESERKKKKRQTKNSS